MGASVITVHPGYLTGRQDTPDDIWDMQISAFTRFAGRGKELGLTIAMETMEKRNKEVVIHPDITNQIIAAVNMENFGVTFDISHAHTVMDVVAFIRALRKISKTRADQSVPRVLALRGGRYLQAGGQFHRHVLQAVDCDIDMSIEQGFLDFFGEQALGSDFCERDVRDLVTGGLDDLDARFAAQFRQARLHPAGLP